MLNWRAWAAALATATLLGACGSAHRSGVARVADRPAPVSSTTTTTADPAAVVGYAQPPKVAVYDAPGGSGAPRTVLSNPNEVGAPLVMLVTGRQSGWARVMLPVRPNGSEGWVRETDLKLYRDNTRVVVSLGRHTLELYKNEALVDHIAVAVGSPSSPTPTGQFYVTELLKAPNPSGPYGPYAFGLSAFSNTYTEFEGGPGQIAIHGTNQPYLIGQSISHGCIRLENGTLTRLVNELPVGTPVEIDP